MPIREKGYYNWEGTLKTSRFNWLPIFRNGIGSVYKKKWSKLLFLLCSLYSLVFLVMVYISARPELNMAPRVAKQIGPTDKLFNLYFTFGGIIIFFAVIMCIFAGAELISGDLKFKSFSLYLSRPLTRVDYVMGKFSIVFFYLLLFTLAPGLVLLFFKMLFAGNYPVSFRDFLAVVTFPLVVSFFLGSLGTMLSSLSANARFVKVMIFITYLLSNILGKIFERAFDGSVFSFISIHANMERFSAFLFGIRDGFYKDGFISGMVLLVLAVVFLGIVVIRIKRVEV